MKVSTLEAKATEILLKSKEGIALERLLKTNEEISRMEAALNLLKKKRDEFMDSEIEDIPLHDFTY